MCIQNTHTGVYTSVRMYMHTYTYICGICIRHVYTHLHVYVYMYVCMNLFVDLFIYVHTHVCIFMHACMRVCMCVPMYVPIYIIYVCVYMRKDLYTFTNIMRRVKECMTAGFLVSLINPPKLKPEPSGPDPHAQARERKTSTHANSLEPYPAPQTVGPRTPPRDDAMQQALLDLCRLTGPLPACWISASSLWRSCSACWGGSRGAANLDTVRCPRAGDVQIRVRLRAGGS